MLPPARLYASELDGGDAGFVAGGWSEGEGDMREGRGVDVVMHGLVPAVEGAANEALGGTEDGDMRREFGYLDAIGKVLDVKPGQKRTSFVTQHILSYLER